MRQAVFVVVMVAAAFLGGAAVNGPGVRWVQARLLDYLGLKEGEIASVDLPGASPEAAGAHDAGASSTAGEPTANPPSIAAQDPAGKQDTPRTPIGGSGPAGASSPGRGRSKSARTVPQPGQSSAEPGSAPQSGVANVLGSLFGLKGENGAGRGPGSSGAKEKGMGDSPSPPPLPASTAPPEPGAPGPGEAADDSRRASTADKVSHPIRRTASSSEVAAPSPAVAKQGLMADGRSRSRPAGPPGLEPPVESSPGQANAVDPAAGPAPGPPPAPLDPTVAPAILASLSPSASSRSGAGDRARSEMMPLETAPSPSESPPSTGAGPGTPASPGVDAAGWAALRRKLQSVGVTRYTIEGEPGGRVVFSCLIPLAGRQAVSQRFEAEGDDEFQAAQAAIRRIALWRATRQAPAQPR
jgi:hypothetical protein